jgi:flagellar biosynthesis protein FliP
MREKRLSSHLFDLCDLCDVARFLKRPNTSGGHRNAGVRGLLLSALLVVFFTCLSSSAWATGADIGLGNLNIQIGQSGAASTSQSLSTGLQLLLFMTVLTMIPAILMMSTAFTRIVIVMSLMRQAIGTPQLPPNQIVIGLSLILTFFVMAPTFDQINQRALKPYLENQIPIEMALERASQPLRSFMFKQTSQEDIELFSQLAKLKTPKTTLDVPTYVLLPAFAMSELKTAFQFGFVVFLPFLVIDMVVSSILVSMGMLFLPPMTISLPFKLILLMGGES